MNFRTKLKLNTFTLLIPWIITFLLFWLYPLIYSLYLSFTKYYTLTNESEFIGLANYQELFSDPLFYKALSNTAFFTFGTVPFTISIAILLALFLNSKIVKLKNFFRSAYFLPSVTSMVVIALIFTNLYTQNGYVNMLFKMAGLPYPENGWLLNTSTAMLSIMFMDVWISVGYYMVLFLAAMQTISEDLYESARLVGANSIQQFFRITLPLLKPTLLFVLVINTIKSFQIFIEIFVMTKGGPLNSTTTLVYQVFVNAFEKADSMGYASALAYIIFIILLIFSFIQMKLLKAKW